MLPLPLGVVPSSLWVLTWVLHQHPLTPASSIYSVTSIIPHCCSHLLCQMPAKWYYEGHCSGPQPGDVKLGNVARILSYPVSQGRHATGFMLSFCSWVSD